MAATIHQFNAVKLAYKLCKKTMSGLYVYQLHNKLLVYTELPLTFEAVSSPDMVVYADGTLTFAAINTFLHRSLILTFLPIIPGIAYFVLRCRVKRCNKIDKYSIKDAYVNELNPANAIKSN